MRVNLPLGNPLRIRVTLPDPGLTPPTRAVGSVETGLDCKYICYGLSGNYIWAGFPLPTAYIALNFKGSLSSDYYSSNDLRWENIIGTSQYPLWLSMPIIFKEHDTIYFNFANWGNQACQVEICIIGGEFLG
jgi:hypothetical protein